MISQVLVPKDPRQEQTQWGQNFWVEKWLSPTCDPSSWGQTRPGASVCG